jgi:4-nitrophenyl phosphatase
MSKNPKTPGTTAGHDSRGRVVTDARLARARHLLVDLDGTLVRQQEAIAGAAERIVLAGELAVRQLVREHPGARVLLAASPALQRFARSLGCQQVQVGADFVLLALDMQFSHARLALVVNELLRGARLVVSNADATHPGPQGRVVPETGALLAAVVAASGVQPWRVVGKPAPLLFEEGLRCLGARAEDTVVVGDNPLTDAEGAARLGMACVLVGTARGAVAPSVAGLLAGPVEVAAAEGAEGMEGAEGIEGAASAAAPPQYRLSDSTSKVWRSVRTEVS